MVSWYLSSIFVHPIFFIEDALTLELHGNLKLGHVYPSMANGLHTPINGAYTPINGAYIGATYPLMGPHTHQWGSHTHQLGPHTHQWGPHTVTGLWLYAPSNEFILFLKLNVTY